MQYSAVLYVHDARHCRQSRYPFLNILPFFPSCVFNYLGVNLIPVQCPVGAIHPHVYSLHCSRMRDILCRGLDLLNLEASYIWQFKGTKGVDGDNHVDNWGTYMQHSCIHACTCNPLSHIPQCRGVVLFLFCSPLSHISSSTDTPLFS